MSLLLPDILVLLILFHCRKTIYCKLFNLLIPQLLELIDLLSIVTQEKKNLEEYLMNRLRDVMDEIGDNEALRGLTITDKMENHLNFIHDWILKVIYDAKDLVKDVECSEENLEENLVHNMEEMNV